jgi:integration host factor subunit beta
MNRSDLITRISEIYPKLLAKDVEFAVKVILDAMSTSLSLGEHIEFRGFGSFSVHTRPGRLGRNPKTGEKVEVPVKHTPHFKPGAELRERVNGSIGAQNERQLLESKWT